ncbi:MAG TPA: type II toxin-antitoxin system HicB family antitoxin [Ensifer sp.]|nr:type II toxin-antitoxin system HicB family antitoxin [Ensifer sp.]
MNNVLEIDGYKAIVTFDPEIDLLRGEFINLNGGADFYASSIEALREEGRRSLEVFLEMCREKGVEPKRAYSGRFNLRLDPEVHAAAAVAAAAEHKSLNEWVADTIEKAAAG